MRHRASFFRDGLVALAVVVTVLTAAPRATAQEVSAADAEAHSLFEAGRTAYAAGRLEAALDYFQRAYDLSHRPGLLYNVASAAELLHDSERALAAYRGYLAATPDAENRVLIEQRIGFLEGLLAEEAAATTSEASSEDAPVDPAPRRADDPGVGPWLVVGGGALLVVTGAILVGVAQADADAVAGAPLDSAWRDFADEAERAPILGGVGGAALGIGVAMVAGGLGWALAPRTESGTTSVAVGPGTITIRVGF